jgi:hypothetical protein
VLSRFFARATNFHFDISVTTCGNRPEANTAEVKVIAAKLLERNPAGVRRVEEKMGPVNANQDPPAGGVRRHAGRG